MRKLAVAAAVSLALASGGARALILGEIDMRSALNQPMNAEIRLASVETGELDGMIVKLASPEAFARAGIDRSNALNDLKFAVVSNNNGEPVIRITSKKPVLEPFLNFLLEVDWTRGRMVREYTVLLDPPVFMTPTAAERSTVGDTPAVVDASSDDSILTPVAIDRSGAAPFDESSVVVVGDDTETSDAQAGVEVDLNDLVAEGEVVELGNLNEVEDGGTVVSLDGLGDELLGTSDPSAVALTDPAVQDTEVSFDGSSWNAETGWEVAVLGDTTEVGDDVGAALPQAETVALSESVSLDDLDVSVGSSSGTAGSSVEVQRNDTLFEIARDNQLQGLSTEQMMLALLDANQQAFINGNINLVKAGAILRIPENSEVAVLSQSEAVAQVGLQAQLWREYRDNLRGSSSNTQVAQADTSADNNSSSAADTDTASVDTGSEQAGSSESTDVASSVSNGSSTLSDNNAEQGAAADQNTVASVAAGSVSGVTEQVRNELKIVANDQSSSTVASTTADETDSPEAARLGEINLKLKLAREELAAARLEAGELSEQNTELESMTQNMDQLVTMRQDQLAKLQAQLEAAQENADASSADTDVAQVADATENVGTTIAESAGVTAETMQANADAAGDVVADATESATAAVTGAADEAADAVASVAGSAADATGTAADAASTALAANQAEPWYKQYVSDPKVLGMGVGGLALGGLAFALLRRRKRDDVEEDLDEVVFMDEEDASSAVAAAPISAADMKDEAEAHVAAAEEEAEEKLSDQGFDQDQTVSVDTAADELDATTVSNDSKDDTVSEAEVYLAYGLHGQAEDLLGKAIEKEPENADYRLKLMQTYHAQNKSSEFEELATDYHARFGGASSPEWGTVIELGKDMSPSNPLFLESNASVESLGKGDLNAPKLDFDDFLEEKSSDAEEGVSSQVREFSSSDDEVMDMAEDDSPLDQTMDPAAEFSESDLEATGDFTQLSNELTGADASNDDSDEGGLEFPSDLADGVSNKVAGAAAGLAGAVGLSGLGSNEDDTESLDFDGDLSAIGDGTVDVGGIDLDADIDDLSSLLPDSDDDAAASAEDLTMDLDNLESNLDLTQDLDIPDLGNGDDLTADASAAFGNVDEMETMMDLAKAYIDMGDNDSASSALGEIVKSGSPEQKTEAESLLKKIS
ncbi:MAG: hypothetical protein KTR33_05975 [Gammaproteobacteria bacterium]|nr:hypothetical protein [Gammaproteobacteria bacterium]